MLLRNNYHVIGTVNKNRKLADNFAGDSSFECHELNLSQGRQAEDLSDIYSEVTDIVFAAGVESEYGIMDCTEEDLLKQYYVHVFSPLMIIQKVMEVNQSKVRNIIFIASNSAKHLDPVSGAYGLSKACVCNLVTILDKELQKRQVKVNAVLPGWCETDMAERLTKVRNKDVQAVKGSKLFGEILRPEEVAEMCLFLLSENARNVHGQIIEIDAV